MLTASRSALKPWLDSLAKSHKLIAPRLVEDEPLYQAVTGSADILFDFERATLSPKTFLLPDTEVILDVVKQDGQVTVDAAGMEEEQVIFAIRPCDARGLLALDALLLDRPPADAYYARHRARTTLVGLACPRLWDDCFCTSLGSSPDDPSGLDVMLYQEDTGYRIEAITEKGKTILAGLAAKEAESSVPASDVSGETVPVLPPEAWGALFEDAYWQRLAERCLSCHACTYVCPTCRCFDVRDDTVSAGPGQVHIQRLRAWDSCLAPGYRRIAGGHNPRPTKAQRLRNRYYCRFRTSPLEFGAVACVGCGRCTAVCPVGIDIAEMLADVTALASC